MAFALPFWGPDPAPSLVRSKAFADRLDCTWMGPEAGRAARVGQIREDLPRGDFVDRKVAICQERILRPGLRASRDEAILMDLGPQVRSLTAAAAATRPDLADRTWVVEGYYPNAQVVPKLRFAAMNGLMDAGLSVSERLPTLAAGDIDVLTRMAPDQAYAGACTRYTQTGSLRAGDALLAIVHLDPRETILHGAVCADGRWTWLQ